jgi:hypothetical protein
MFHRSMRTYQSMQQGESSRELGETTQQQGEESLLRNQQDDISISEHTRPHYPGQEPSQHGYYYPKGQEKWDNWDRDAGDSH